MATNMLTTLVMFLTIQEMKISTGGRHMLSLFALQLFTPSVSFLVFKIFLPLVPNPYA